MSNANEIEDLGRPRASEAATGSSLAKNALVKSPFDQVEIATMSNTAARINCYLRNPQKPKGVTYWAQKQESYVTLSMIVRDQKTPPLDRITGLQQRILQKVEGTDVVHDPYKQNVECLFVYPEDRFHCSLVNFLASPYDFDAFKSSSRLKYAKIYGRLIEKLKATIEACLGQLSLSRTQAKAKIAGLYPGSECVFIDSASLQLFPDAKFIKALEKIESSFLRDEKIKALLCKLPFCQKDGKVKGYGPSQKEIERFPINMLRFMHAAGCGEPVSSGQEIGSEIQRINKEQAERKNWLELDIQKLVLIESDPFLCRWNKIAEFPILPRK